jgi:hypothetical protein
MRRESRELRIFRTCAAPAASQIGHDPPRLIAGAHLCHRRREAFARFSKSELLNKDSVGVGVDTHYKGVGTCYFARRIRQFR